MDSQKEKLEQLRVRFNKMTIRQKEDFIEDLKKRLAGSKNIEYNKFLNECIKQYNIDVGGESSFTGVETRTCDIDTNILYEKTIEEYMDNGYRIVNQTNSSTELEKPPSYIFQIIILSFALINFTFINWIVGGMGIIISLFSFVIAAMNKNNRVFISVLNGNVKTTGNKLEDQKKIKNTSKTITFIIIIVISFVVLLGLILPMIS